MIGVRVAGCGLRVREAQSSKLKAERLKDESLIQFRISALFSEFRIPTSEFIQFFNLMSV